MRTKGAKNKATLIKEILALSPQANVDDDGMSYQDVKNLLASIQTGKPVDVVAVETTPKPAATTVSTDLAQTIYDATMMHLDAMRIRYGADEVPERIKDFLLKVWFQPDGPAADQLAHKAIVKMETHLLAQWARKKIRGPIDSITNVESLIKRHESAAKMLEGQGNAEAAASQMAKADGYREELGRLVQAGKQSLG